MNHRCKATEPLLAEALFGELAADDRLRLEEHLAGCPTCAARLGAMRHALQVTASRVPGEPDEAFWTGYVDRLEARMEAERRPDFRQALLRSWERVSAHVWPQPTWVLNGLAAAALLLIGVFAGRFLLAPEPSSYPDEPVATSSPGDAAVALRASQYLDRSQVLLLGLVNFDVETDDPSMLNLPRKREIARELIDEAGVLKSDLAGTDEQRLVELISDLEVILLQLANLESQRDVPAIEMVRSGVDRRAILFKINLTQMRLMDPVAPATRAPSADRNDSLSI
jgi:hypothetical protein